MAKHGPALAQHHAHHAIHEGARSGAIQKTDELVTLLKQGEIEAAKMAADDLIEYWQTRVIAHADTEESGFYQEMVKEKPELKEAVIELARDHEILRILLRDIQQLIQEHGITSDVMMKFHALIAVNEIHSREEEKTLFDDER